MSDHSDIKIYFNPECSKCVMALDLIQQNGARPEVVEYLNNVPSKEELKEIVALLKIKPSELLRKSESLYLEQYEGKEYSDDEWLDIMIQNPILIQRPIVISNGKAVIGRPPEKVLALL